MTFVVVTKTIVGSPALNRYIYPGRALPYYMVRSRSRDTSGDMSWPRPVTLPPVSAKFERRRELKLSSSSKVRFFYFFLL